MRHMPQLDGLRGLAVLAVVAHHNLALPGQIGGYGVRLFFVLSGFLITGILLRARGEADTPRVLGSFYARRFLRIFPLYYTVIAITALFGVARMRENWTWHALYGGNLLVALEGRFVDAAGHFYTLAIEEQFYLLWPLLVLLTPRAYLVPAFWACVAVGPLSRTAVFLATENYVSSAVVTTSCLDSLCLGAVLATGRLNTRVGLAVGALLFGVYALDVSPLDIAARDLSIALGAAWLIASAAHGLHGPVGWILSWSPVRYLGTISYGVYILHELIPAVISKLQESGTELWLTESRGLARFVYVLSATVVLAAFSWHFFEKPLIGLKRYFPYTGRSKVEPDIERAPAVA